MSTTEARVNLDYATNLSVFYWCRHEAQIAVMKLAQALGLPRFLDDFDHETLLGHETYARGGGHWVARYNDAIEVLDDNGDGHFWCHWVSTFGEVSLIVDYVQGSFSREVADAIRSVVGCSRWYEISGEDFCSDEDDVD